jgi:anti-sigma factor RsiW
MASDSASAATAQPPHVGRWLGAYVLGTIAPEDARRVREHLAACELCAAEHAALARTAELLRQFIAAG